MNRNKHLINLKRLSKTDEAQYLNYIKQELEYLKCPLKPTVKQQSVNMISS